MLPDLAGITEETLEAVKKAQTSGILNTTGLFGYDLSQWVSLVPVETPFRNMMPRVGSPDGNPFAVWRALLNVNASQPNPAVGFDYAGTLVITSEQDMQAPYQPIAMAGRVTQDAVDLAKGYADARAIEALMVLNQLMIGEDILLLGGQNFALQTVGTITCTTATTGGSIASGGDLDVQVSARTLANYFYGGNGIGSAATRATCGTTTSTNKVTATWTAIQGATAYDVFVGTHSGTMYYYTTVTVNAAVITSIPTAAQAVPSLPLINTTTPVLATSDHTAVAAEFNGLMATLAGDYNASGTLVSHGSGTASGCKFTSLDNAKLTVAGGSIPEIDAMLLSIWNNALLSPQKIMMNAQQAQDIGADILGTNAAVTYLTPDDQQQRLDVVAGGFVGRYVNKAAGGKVLNVEVHPHLPPGTMIFRTDTVPYPNANMARTCEVRTLRDYADFSYGANYNPGVAGGGPREDFEVRSVEAFINRAPGTMGVISNIQNG